MKNLLTASQIKDVDAYTIQHQPIASIDLMEQAALAFVKIFAERFQDTAASIWVLCGQGNNGGDGLAIARLLFEKGYTEIKLFLTSFSANSSADYLRNLERIDNKIPIFRDLKELNLSDDDIVIDAILGSGLNKPLKGGYEKLTVLVNTSKAYVMSVDVPTGFKSEGQLEADYTGIKADFVITFQLPKLNFFFPESAKAVKQFEVVHIGLDESYIQSLSTHWKLINEFDIRKALKPRKIFSHKGTYGHALIVAGNTETMGAALLTAGACLHAGVGLVTASIPQSGLTALNVSLPEAMFLNREHLATVDLDKFKAITIGPGLGFGDEEVLLLKYLLHQQKPLVLDADALNILAEHKSFLEKLPAQSVITPHMKEFDRLFGAHENWWQRVEKARQKAQELQIVIVLKNQYTFVCLPTGDVCINPTGSPAMAQGGMGDVLTGIITSFLAQGYAASEAAILGVYLHGSTGDFLAQEKTVIIASQLSKNLSETLKKIQ